MHKSKVNPVYRLIISNIKVKDITGSFKPWNPIDGVSVDDYFQTSLKLLEQSYDTVDKYKRELLSKNKMKFWSMLVPKNIRFWDTHFDELVEVAENKEEKLIQYALVFENLY